MRPFWEVLPRQPDSSLAMLNRFQPSVQGGKGDDTPRLQGAFPWNLATDGPWLKPPCVRPCVWVK